MTRDPVVAVAEILWFRHNRVRDGVGDFYAEAREIVAAAVESIAAGFDSLADAAKTADREHRDVDVVLAHQSAARFVRSHAGNRFPSAAAAVSSPGGTPGAPNLSVRVYSAPQPVADGRCANCGDPVVYNLAISYVRHKDADESTTCTKPWPATSPTGDRP